MIPLRLTKAQRVVRSDDFTRAIRCGGCAADGTLVVFAFPTRGDSDADARPPDRVTRDDPVAGEALPLDARADRPARLGVTIPKRTGNAVHRNQWKRRIREAFRIHQAALPAGYDFVVRPKKGAEPCWREIEKSLRRLPKKAVGRLQR